MSEITKLIYSCGHQATNAFRDRGCPNPNTPACVPEQHNRQLDQGCPQCIRRARRYDPELLKRLDPYPQRREDALGNIFWDIPSRCFTDPGFVRIDPFAADRMKQQMEATERARAARFRSSSFSGFRQKWHSMRMSGRPQSMSPGEVVFQLPIASCCQKHRFWNMCNGRVGKSRYDDDRCESQF